MSLREEIEKYLADKPTVDFNKLDMSKDITNDILSKIEKRIDSLIEPYKNSEDMLGQSILEKLLEVKELLK